MRRRGGNNAGLILLALQVAQIGFDKIPPVTLIVGAINVLLHYVDTRLSIYDVCIGAGMVWHRLDLRRLLLASFFHLDDMHLYYNMVSLLWKGRDLEPRMGSKVPTSLPTSSPRSASSSKCTPATRDSPRWSSCSLSSPTC